MASTVYDHSVGRHDSLSIPNQPKKEGRSRAFILDLPAHLLEAIFLEAGLRTRFNLNLVAPRISPAPAELSPRATEINAGLQSIGISPQSLPHDAYHGVRHAVHQVLSCMLTCRRFYRLTVGILCNTNNILLNMRTIHDLEKALALSSIWFERLQLLTVELSGPLAKCTKCYRREKRSFKGLRPLTLDLEEDKAYVKKWQSLWIDTFQSRLPATPQLSLQLVCHVADEETAIALLQPLLQSSRRLLKHCSIRLRGLPKTVDLRSSAAAAVAAVTSDKCRDELVQCSFHFFDLPVEIRRSILEYTDLVKPWGQLQWCNRGYDWEPVHDHSLNGPADEAHLFSVSRSQRQGCSIGSNDFDRYRRRFDGYFCQTLHTAATSEPLLRCSTTCWKFPINLVLANRAMCQEAMDVVFRKNRIVVLPQEDDVKTGWMTLPTRLPISIFISRHMTFDRSCWHNLRFLDIVFPWIISASCCDAEGDGNNALQEWTESLTAVRDVLNLSQLTIQVTIARWWSSPGGFAEAQACSEHAYMACYASLLQPLSVLGGLARLYVLLPRIDKYEAGRLYGEPISKDEIISRRERMEAALEAFIMGDSFDAKQAGKCVELQPWWLRALHGQTLFWQFGD